jgi:hypothetical protein
MIALQAIDVSVKFLLIIQTTALGIKNIKPHVISTMLLSLTACPTKYRRVLAIKTDIIGPHISAGV